MVNNIDEQKALIIKAQNGDESAMTKLLNDNKNLIIFMAKKYKNSNHYKDDILQEAKIAFCHAIKKIDINKENKFSTYICLWIKHRITRFLEQNKTIVKTPYYFLYMLKKINIIKNKYLMTYGKLPTKEYISKKVKNITRKFNRKNEFDVDNIYTEYSLIEDIDIDDIYYSEQRSNFEKNEMKYIIENIMSTLNNEEIEILNERWLNEKNSLKTMSNKINISSEAIRKREKKLFLKLKNNEKIQELAKVFNIF